MYLCSNCTDQFKTEEALKAHIKEVHVMARRSDFKIPPSIIEKAKEVTHKQEDVEKKEVVQEESVPVKKERKPIVLKYVFEGQCEVCGVPVETHEITISTNLFMIAWCSSCRIQKKDIQVIPIEKQNRKEAK